MSQAISIEAIHAPLAVQRRLMPWYSIGLGAILLAYALMLFTHQGSAITGVDDNGYFAQGTLLAQTGRTWFTQESDAQYVGMHWLLTPKGHYISRYPPGLAVAIAALDLVGGYRAATLINPICALLALVGLAKALSLTRIPTVIALATVAMLAANGIFAEHALAGDSHMSVAAIIAWLMVVLIRWAQKPTYTSALIAGLLLGIVPTIRYPDTVMAFGAAAFVWMHRKQVPNFWRHVGVAAIGFGLIVLPLMVRNQLVLGAFWRTGYALTGEQTGFSFAYFQQHALDYIRQLSSSGVGLPLALGLMGMVAMLCDRLTRALGLLLVLLTVPMVLVYMAYYWAPQGNGGMTMRFLVPTFAAYLFAAAWLIWRVSLALPKSAGIAMPLVLAALQLLTGVPEVLQTANRSFSGKQHMAIATDALDQVAQRGDVVITDNAFMADLDFVRHFKLADASLITGMGGGPGGGGFGGGGMRGGMDGGGMRGPGGEGGPGGPSPMQREKQTLLRGKYTGTTAQKFAKFSRDVTTWANGSSIWFIGSRNELTSTLGSDAQVQIVRTIQLPQQPQAMNGGGGFGNRRGGMGGGMNGGGFGGPRGGDPDNGPMGGGDPMNGPPDGIGPGGDRDGGPGFGGGNGGGGFGGNMNGGGFGRRGGMGGAMGGPGGGGPPGMNAFGGATEIVIARWTPKNS